MEQLVTGFVRGSHGITGEFKVESASGRYEHFSQLDEVTLRNGTTGDERLFKVESVKNAGRDLYMKLAGIDSPEDAQKFNRWEIVVPRDKACPLEENEWYVEDLKNCSLVYCGTENGLAEKSAPEVVGTITDVKEGGSGNLLEILLAENCGCLDDKVKFNSKGQIRTVYVPFRNEFIGKVDVKNKTIQLMHLWILE